MAVAADGTVWLADTGDNDADRPTVALIALRPDGSTSVYRLTYPDGPHDAEALLLAPDGTPYVVTKEVLGASGVYRPAAPLVDGGTVALGKVVDGQPHAHRHARRARSGGPASCWSPAERSPADGSAIALRTYTDAYVWPLTGSDVVGAPWPRRRRGSRCRTRRRARRSASPRTTATCWSPARGCPATVTVVPARAGDGRRARRRRAGEPVPSLTDLTRSGPLADHRGARSRRPSATAVVWSWIGGTGRRSPPPTPRERRPPDGRRVRQTRRRTLTTRPRTVASSPGMGS